MKPFFTMEDFDGAISSSDEKLVLKMDKDAGLKSLGFRVYSNVTAIANAKVAQLFDMLEASNLARALNFDKYVDAVEELKEQIESHKRLNAHLMSELEKAVKK